MIKKALVATAILLTAACSSLPLKNNGQASASAGSSSFTNPADSYIMLDSPGQIRAMDYSRTLNGLYITGTLTNHGFVSATGKVEGKGSFCSDGKDWFSLSDLSVHKAGDNKSPSGSYVLGCAKGSSFVPASRDIVTQ